jgi:minor extracellular serine protease Vpr
VQIKAALMNTAKPLVKMGRGQMNSTADESLGFYRTYEQGAGRIQVDEAIKATSLVSPSSMRFGKYSDDHDVHQATLHVENRSSETKRYSFSIPQRMEGLSWRFPLSFTLGPKESKEVTVELMVDPKVFLRKVHDGYIQMQAGSSIIHIPYLYVLEEPGYPRVMGFDFGESDHPGQYRYEVYLPGGAEEFGIALFSPGDYRFVGFLDTKTNVKKGLIRKVIPADQLPEDGTYLVKVFAKKAGKEDFIERMIVIEREKE